MAQPALDIFRSLDQALAGAVAVAAPSVVHVSRSHTGGTGIVWATDLVISASFHTPDRTQIGVGTDGDLDLREAEVIGRDPGTDVALLRVASGGLTPATFRELDDLAVGNVVLALGRPAAPPAHRCARSACVAPSFVRITAASSIITSNPIARFREASQAVR